MIHQIRRDVRRWAGRGHWTLVMCKTALTHAAVWCGTTLLGAVLGLAAIWAGGVHPFWAICLPLLGYALGARFYLDRELTGPDPDFFEKGTWKGRLDSFLDFVVPWVLASALMYVVTLVYPAVA